MRTLTIVLSLAIVLAFSMVNAGEKKADFSGTWTFNEEKSELGEGGRWMIASKISVTQKDSVMTIERTAQRRGGEEFTTSEKLTLDGKECENTMNERTRKSTANWSEDGKQLTIASKMVFEREGNQFEIKSVEIWQLTNEGKALSIDYTSQSPRGERKAVYVYDKVTEEKK
jgi:hypothetical protein